MRSQENVETLTIVARGEAEESLAILTDVVMDVEETRRHGFEFAKDTGCDNDEVTDPPDFDKDGRRRDALENDSPQRTDHLRLSAVAAPTKLGDIAR